MAELLVVGLGIIIGMIAVVGLLAVRAWRLADRRARELEVQVAWLRAGQDLLARLLINRIVWPVRTGADRIRRRG